MINTDKNLTFTSKVEWPEVFKKYHKCIYTRLDLPEPPTVDEDKFKWWCEKSHQFLLNSPKVIQIPNTNKQYISAYHLNELVRKTPFPYKMYPAITKAKSMTDDPWVENFNTLFPDLVDYFYMFPGYKFRSLGFIQQIPNTPIWEHVDADEWIGFRFYLKNNCEKNNLYFKKIKKEYCTGERYDTYISADTEDRCLRDYSKITEDQKIYPINNTGNYAWALSSTLAAHGIDPAKDYEERITGVMEFWPINYEDKLAAGFKIKQTLDLLERSITKFSNEVIWY